MTNLKKDHNLDARLAFDPLVRCFMAARTGRKAELRRLAAKRGWDDGHDGYEAAPPTKAVMKPFANGFQGNPVPWDEEKAYWDGYFEGEIATHDAKNPYRT